MITPNYYFSELKRNGFRFSTNSQVRSPAEYWGTARRRTISRYVASNNINGHLISIDGDVHVVDEDVCVSAKINLTNTLLQVLNPLIEVPTFSSVTAEEFAEILHFVRVAKSLGACTDYEVINGGKV